MNFDKRLSTLSGEEIPVTLHYAIKFLTITKGTSLLCNSNDMLLGLHRQSNQDISQLNLKFLEFRRDFREFLDLIKRKGFDRVELNRIEKGFDFEYEVQALFRPNYPAKYRIVKDETKNSFTEMVAKVTNHSIFSNRLDGFDEIAIRKCKKLFLNCYSVEEMRVAYRSKLREKFFGSRCNVDLFTGVAIISPTDPEKLTKEIVQFAKVKDLNKEKG